MDLDRTSLPPWISGATVDAITAIQYSKAMPDGRMVHTGPRTRAGVLATIADAERMGKGTIAYFPPGFYDVGVGIPLAGYSCQIRGAGAAGTTADPSGTVFQATTQTGPVFDFTNWVAPQSFQGKVVHEGFHIIGSELADATKNNAGIRLKSVGSTIFRDISIQGTGGPCLEGVTNPGDQVYLCDFERIVFNTPVGAKANDVPYMVLDSPNSNRFRGIGFRSITPSADVGVSGALVITNNASYSGWDNVFDSCWMEYLHAPNGGALISHTGNTALFDGFSFPDCGKETGATGTAFARFLTPSVENAGGNTWRGVVPGSGGTATELDTGVDIRQSRNRVEGVKGYKGYNVTLASGVVNNYVSLGGSVSGATDPAVVDNSGNATNHVFDHTIAKPTVTGSRGSNAALASLLTALADYGLIVNSTT